jgi:hypothetical protein
MHPWVEEECMPAADNESLNTISSKNGFSQRTISRAQKTTTAQTLKMNEHQEGDKCCMMGYTGKVQQPVPFVFSRTDKSGKKTTIEDAEQKRYQHQNLS